MLIATRLAPFRLAFSTKLRCVLSQNATRLAPKYHAFSTKTHINLHQIPPKPALIENLCKENAFSYIYNSPLFASK